MRVEVIETPTERPVSLAEAKIQTRIDHDDDDAYIEMLIDVAASRIAAPDGLTNRSLCLQTLRASTPRWPCKDLRLPAGPVVAVESVKFYDTDNVLQTVPTSDWFLASRGALTMVDDFVGDALYPRPDAVQITYTAGHADPLDIPASLRHAVLLLISQLYDRRGEPIPSSIVPDPTLASFLTPFRRLTA